MIVKRRGWSYSNSWQQVSLFSDFFTLPQKFIFKIRQRTVVSFCCKTNTSGARVPLWMGLLTIPKKHLLHYLRGIEVSNTQWDSSTLLMTENSSFVSCLSQTKNKQIEGKRQQFLFAFCQKTFQIVLVQKIIISIVLSEL